MDTQNKDRESDPFLLGVVVSDHRIVHVTAHEHAGNGLNTPYMAQTPSLTLDEIALRLWQLEEFDCYRAVMAWSKERKTMLELLKEYERGL